MFNGRDVIIATNHGKEKVLAPLMIDAFQMKVQTIEGFNSDQFGTFSGEVERIDDPIATLRKKCIEAAAISHADLIIASEGSFGVHPSVFFIPANEEYLMVYDRRHDVEIIAKELSTDTNFNGSVVKGMDELNSFAETAQFPSHRLILRDRDKGTAYLQKGIDDPIVLQKCFEECMRKHDSVFVETDMRAMYNPTRMRVIESCAKKLIDKMKSHCPICTLPGFGITEAVVGLPCSWCNAPTSSTLKYRSTCARCGFVSETYYPHKKQYEDPMYCDRCNP